MISAWAGNWLLLFLYSLANSSLVQYIGCWEVQGREEIVLI
ncbi:MAG TPA: hypothetical protein PKY20_04470 [Methanothrix sp.]|nr:hypothetical protein [Methanothrix sp.]